MINKSLSVESVPLQELWQKSWHNNIRNGDQDPFAQLANHQIKK